MDSRSRFTEKPTFFVSCIKKTNFGTLKVFSKDISKDLSPIISKCDLHLAGWRGRTLPIGGRLILVNSVITAKFAHAMSAGLLPAGAVEAIDRRCRAFLGMGEENVLGDTAKLRGRMSASQK